MGVDHILNVGLQRLGLLGPWREKSGRECWARDASTGIGSRPASFFPQEKHPERKQDSILENWLGFI